MATTRKEFLRWLRLSLFFHLSSNEAREVLEDYEGFFEERFEEGKTEEEICREFGSPQEIAKTILKEEGKSAKPLGVLALVWGLLGPWIARFGFCPFLCFTMASNPGLLSSIILLWIPILWVLWRKAVYPAIPPKRGAFTALCVLPLPIWGVFWGFLNYAVNKPLEFYTFFERWANSEIHMYSTVGMFVGTLGEIVELMTAAIFLLCVLLAWVKSPWYLIPAAQALGAFAAIERALSLLKFLNIDHAGVLAAMMLLYPLRTYLFLGLGGAALTALLVWKGGRCGRAA